MKLTRTVLEELYKDSKTIDQLQKIIIETDKDNEFIHFFPFSWNDKGTVTQFIHELIYDGLVYKQYIEKDEYSITEKGILTLALLKKNNHT